MNALISDAFAQSAPAAPGGFQGAPLVMMVVFIAIFYFLLIRPQQKKAREHQTLISKLTAGDEVVTTGGILGRIVETSDSFVTLEIAEGVRIKVQRVQIGGLVPKGTMKSA